MANSAQIVLPLPVGAPMNTFSSESYNVLNTGIKKKELEQYCGAVSRVQALNP